MQAGSYDAILALHVEEMAKFVTRAYVPFMLSQDSLRLAGQLRRGQYRTVGFIQPLEIERLVPTAE